MFTRLYCRLVAALRPEVGATAVEYGVMVALIAIVVIVAVALVGTNLDLVFDNVGAWLGSPTLTPAP